MDGSAPPPDLITGWRGEVVDLTCCNCIRDIVQNHGWQMAGAE